MGRIVCRWWLGPWCVVVVVVVVDLCCCVNWMENELHRVIEIFVDQLQRRRQWRRIVK